METPIDNSSAPPVDPLAPVAPRKGRYGWIRYGLAPLVAVVAILGAVWWVDQQGKGARVLGVTNPAEIAASSLEVGKPAPDFVATGVEGPDLRLSDQRGKVVVVNFWATWCGPCRAEMPELDSVYQEYKDRGVTILGIDYQESAEDVRRFTRSLGVNYAFGLDRDGSIARAYRVVGFPTTYFIDRDGNVVEARVGPVNRELVVDRLKKLLAPS